MQSVPAGPPARAVAAPAVDARQHALSWLFMLRMEQEKIDRELPASVARARAAGATWSEIAEPLGMTRQGATKRFGGEV